MTYLQAAYLPTASALLPKALPRQPETHPSALALTPPPQATTNGSTAGSSFSPTSSTLGAHSEMSSSAPFPAQSLRQPKPLNHADTAEGGSSSRPAPSEPLGGVTTLARAPPPLQSMYSAPCTCWQQLHCFGRSPEWCQSQTGSGRGLPYQRLGDATQLPQN